MLQTKLAEIKLDNETKLLRYALTPCGKIFPEVLDAGEIVTGNRRNFNKNSLQPALDLKKRGEIKRLQDEIVQGNSLTDDIYKCSFQSPGPVPYVCSVSLLKQILQNCKGGKSSERRQPLLDLLDNLCKSEDINQPSAGQKRASPEADGAAPGDFMPSQELIQTGGMILEHASRTKEMFSLAISEAKELITVNNRLLEIEDLKFAKQISANQKLLELKSQSYELDQKNREQELQHILAVAKAKTLHEEVQPPPQPFPQPGAYVTIPEGYTTATTFYYKTYPTYKPRQVKDLKDFLNEVRTFAGQLYRDQNGRPMQVKEGLGSVDMYPTCWKGLARAFSEVLYKFNNRADTCAQPLITGQFQLKMPTGF